MEYARFNKTIVVRLDRGEEVITSISDICRKENITAGKISGIGAANRTTIGIFDPEKQKYSSTTYEGDYEISNITGTVSVMKEEPYLHLHITIGNPVSGQCHAGHLSESVISATSEIFIEINDGILNRRFDDTIGLNILDI